MNFPYIDNANNYLLDYHIVYVGVLIYLMVKRAGHVYGLDAWVEKQRFIVRHPSLRPLFA
jgi:thiosulfate dehydrogenase (quinone) large subunit